jgi:restriction system protein
MSIPDYQGLLLPLLLITQDGQEHNLREVIDELGLKLGLSEEERHKLLPSGRQATFDNRVGWARTYLVKANLLVSAGRGKFQITTEGMDLLISKPKCITTKMLDQYPAFRTFRGTIQPYDPPLPQDPETPEERLEISFLHLKSALTKELQGLLVTCSPHFFEGLVIDLLLSMGYGGSRREAGEAVGQSGDGGIDGIIKEDRLGLDSIYIQAKRWDAPVGRPVAQAFVGSLEGRRARKGVLITTSTFSQQAQEYVRNIEKKVVLIDGEQLVQLMIEHNIGVKPINTFIIKMVDRDYFEPDGAT